MKCLGSYTAPGADPARLDVHASQINLRDSVPPAVAAVSGPLTESGRTQSGSTSVTVRATDTGGGVASFALEVDGKPVATAGAPGCHAEPYTSPMPCPADASQTRALDTTTLATGAIRHGSSSPTWVATRPVRRRSQCESTTATALPTAPWSASLTAGRAAGRASRG